MEGKIEDYLLIVKIINPSVHSIYQETHLLCSNKVFYSLGRGGGGGGGGREGANSGIM